LVLLLVIIARQHIDMTKCFKCLKRWVKTRSHSESSCELFNFTTYFNRHRETDGAVEAKTFEDNKENLKYIFEIKKFINFFYNVVVDW